MARARQQSFEPQYRMSPEGERPLPYPHWVGDTEAQTGSDSAAPAVPCVRGAA